MMHYFPLPLAEGALRRTFEWGRIQTNADWVLPILACAAVMLFVHYMYRRDAVELPRPLGWFLAALRIAVILGLLVLYLEPQWRLERDITRNSRAIFLIDASLSMGLSDKETASAAPAKNAGASRIGQVAATLSRTDLLEQLRKTHDVSIFQFNDDLLADRSLTLPKISGDKTAPPLPNSLRSASGERPSDKTLDWSEFLKPGGAETRLGQALRQLIHNERGAQLSGIVLVSDGGQNAGISPDAAAALAQEMKLPIFTVGLGSDKRPTDVRVSDLAMPARAYPGDKYTVTGYIQAQHMAGQVVTVELLSRPANSSVKEEGTGKVLESRVVTLGGDGEVIPVKFELTPAETGRSTLCFRVQAPPGDGNPADNFREAEIEIVDRKNRVLLFAGGPMRDYHFLRTLLFRDRSTDLDVLLQTAQPGMSQEGKVLDEFPATREAMFDYDCVVAFDPDWQALNAGQIGLLESWIAEQGGGMIAVAGPVNAGKVVSGWVQEKATQPIRNLYPVEFPRRLSALEGSANSSEEPLPLDFTREGQDADFLWLADTASASRQAWADFPGAFGFLPVRGIKPGATLYARLRDSRLGDDGDRPPYFAGQFYGSGSVFYLGSGEIWRLRALDENYFAQFYTKLIRHVSQGRLLRGSRRGVLLVGQDRYLLGNSVEVRAQLTDARLEPLKAPGVPLQMTAPDGGVQTLTLRPDPSRLGTFVGRFPAMLEGSYRLELPVPESENERLTRRVQVKLPELERENPQRNDALLAGIAKNAGPGGRYYIGMDSILGGEHPLVKELKDRTATVIQPESPDPQSEEGWLKWMMIALCSLLCLEWLIRRLMKLA
ncbi:MAG: VWA domain-containing protein [Pirellulales bacterium]|nr:VWA domain-containing protein [Pirellulales bacterium]